MSTEHLLGLKDFPSTISIEPEPSSSVNFDEWGSYFSPPDPVNLNETEHLSPLRSPLYSGFQFYIPHIDDIYKEEKGPKGRRQQRIINGGLRFEVHNRIVIEPSHPEEEFLFKVLVKREGNSLVEAKKQLGENLVEQEVELKSTVARQALSVGINGLQDGCQWNITTELDSVYAVPNGTEQQQDKQVYKLCTSKTHQTNMFQLVVRIYQIFNDGRVCEVAYIESMPFLVRSRPRPNQSKSRGQSKKRPAIASPGPEHVSPGQSPDPVPEPFSERPRGTDVGLIISQATDVLALVKVCTDKLLMNPISGPPSKRPCIENDPTDPQVQSAPDVQLSWWSLEHSPMEPEVILPSGKILPGEAFPYHFQEPVPGSSPERLDTEHGPTIQQVQATLDLLQHSLNRILDPEPASCESQGTIPKAIVEYIHAHEAFIDKLEIGHAIKTKRKDIAYNFILNNSTSEYEEGDVVVFLEGPDKKTVIELLTQNNYNRAKLAGVISRSNFISGALPENPSEDKKGDLVCIIGIVKVKVHGPVRNGEQLYTSPDRPGIAVTESTFRLMGSDTDIKRFALGQAIEAVHAEDIYEVHLASSFVSIVLGIERQANAKSLEKQIHNVSNKFKTQMTKAGAKVNCKIFFTVIALLVMLSAIGLGLWQRYAPNTLFWRSSCRRGWKENHHICITYKTNWEEIRVHGIEFEFPTLKKKLYNNKKFKEKKIKRHGKHVRLRYFINFDRCINRGATFANQYLDDGRTISGPEVMASDCKKHSTKVFYFINGKWANFTSITPVRCFESDANVVKTCHLDEK